MKKKFQITLKENGIHSVGRGLEILKNYEAVKDNFLLKESIMFLHHGIELLLKQVLLERGGEFLIFSDISERTIKKVISAKKDEIPVFSLDSPPHTATYRDVIFRVSAYVDEPRLNDSLANSLRELNKIRNNLEHYAINDEVERVEKLLFKIKNPLISFFKLGVKGFEGVEVSKLENNWEDIRKNLLEQLLKETSRFRFGSSIKNVSLEGSIVTIEYVKDYDEFQKLRPGANISESLYNSYWDTGDAVIKAIISGSVRILSKFDEVKKVNVIIPYKGDIYKAKVDKEKLGDFLKLPIDDISNTWNEKLSDTYVYSKKGRDNFFENFGEVVPR